MARRLVKIKCQPRSNEIVTWFWVVVVEMLRELMHRIPEGRNFQDLVPEWIESGKSGREGLEKSKANLRF